MQTAPLFTLPDGEGNMISLADFRGKKVVLYFYPRDNTPGCTKQACAFRDAYDGFRTNDIVVIGISKDSSKSHDNFRKKYDLPFILLSDKESDVSERYGVWQEKKLYGKTYWGIVRTTFIIDEDGMIVKTFPKVKPDTNAAEILAYLSTEGGA